MAKFPTYEEMGKKVAEKALDEYIYKGKTLREWIDILGQTQWIPVSERLPLDRQFVICSIAEYADTEYRIIIARYEKDKPWWNDFVDAWMSLPEPYKIESKIEQALAYADQETMMPAT